MSIAPCLRYVCKLMSAKTKARVCLLRKILTMIFFKGFFWRLSTVSLFLPIHLLSEVYWLLLLLIVKQLFFLVVLLLSAQVLKYFLLSMPLLSKYWSVHARLTHECNGTWCIYYRRSLLHFYRFQNIITLPSSWWTVLPSEYLLHSHIAHWSIDIKYTAVKLPCCCLVRPKQHKI